MILYHVYLFGPVCVVWFDICEGKEETMVETKDKVSSQFWWFDNHRRNHCNRSPWLQSTLAELDEKTKTMLRLIEEEADSFAQRAEMYYKKRPQLIGMVEDFYRTHCFLAERYDQLRSESGNQLLRTWLSPLSFTKHRLGKSLSLNDEAYDSYPEAYGPEEFNGSEVDDPEEEEETMQDHVESGKHKVSSDSRNEEFMRLRGELERLKEENKVQDEQLMQKDEDKRDVIRQLSLAMDLLREENMKLEKCVSEQDLKKESPLEINKLKGHFIGWLFNDFFKS